MIKTIQILIFQVNFFVILFLERKSCAYCIENIPRALSFYDFCFFRNEK